MDEAVILRDNEARYPKAIRAFLNDHKAKAKLHLYYSGLMENNLSLGDCLTTKQESLEGGAKIYWSLAPSPSISRTTSDMALLPIRIVPEISRKSTGDYKAACRPRHLLNVQCFMSHTRVYTPLEMFPRHLYPALVVQRCAVSKQIDKCNAEQ